MKKLFSLALLSALLIPAAGCDKPKTTEPAKVDASKDATPPATPPAPAPAATSGAASK